MTTDEKVQLRHIDLRFPGETLALTLWPGDTLEQTEDEIVVALAKTGQRTTVERRNLLFVTEWEREVTVRDGKIVSDRKEA